MSILSKQKQLPLKRNRVMDRIEEILRGEFDDICYGRAKNRIWRTKNKLWCLFEREYNYLDLDFKKPKIKEVKKNEKYRKS